MVEGHLDSLDLPPPPFALGAVASVDEVCLDLIEAGHHLRLDVEHRAANARVLVCARCSVWPTAGTELDLALVEVFLEVVSLSVGHVAVLLLRSQLATPGKVQLVVPHDVLVEDRDIAARRLEEATGSAIEEPARHADGDVVEPTVVERASSDAAESSSAGVIDSGTPGASARREFERRKAKREERIRANHPRLGGLILALSDEKQSTTAWNVGAVGEEGLGKGLDGLASDTIRLLHDRRIPRSRANIDHLAVTATGIYVIDAKKYKGRPHLKIEGGLFRPRVERLLVGSRDCTKLVDGVLKQIDIVRELLDDEVPVHGVLCFVDADWPLIGGAFTTRGVQALWPKKLYAQLQADGPITADAAAEIHRKLAHALPQA